MISSRGSVSVDHDVTSKWRGSRKYHFGPGSSPGPFRCVVQPASLHRRVSAVRFGIFSDLRNPARWRRPWPHVYARQLEVVERAEAAGVDAVWLSEHHFFDD